MIKIIFDFLKGNAMIALLLGYSIMSTLIFNYRIEGLENVNEKIRQEKARAEAELQTTRRIRGIDGQAYTELQTSSKRIEKRRSESINALGNVTDESKNVLDSNIPDDVKRLLK